MVVRINHRKSVSKAINYNEAKVRSGVGELLLAAGFGCEISELGITQKIKRFELLNELNDKITKNTLHISINFPPEEDLPPEILCAIARDYMNRIGFGEQPFLVYRHRDADHPHIHIVTTRIRPDGTDIPIHNIAKDLSAPAREAIEREFGLIPARGRGQKPIDFNAVYDISRKVPEITSSYLYTSLEELNAILADFHLTSTRGLQGSILYKNRGLLYSHTDSYGYKIGTPVPSSQITTRPTLKWLEKQFERNKVRKLDRLEKVRSNLIRILSENFTVQRRARKMAQSQICLHPLANAQTGLSEIYLVDHRFRVVFNLDEMRLTEDQVTQLKQIQNQFPAFNHPIPGKRQHPRHQAKKRSAPSTSILPAASAQIAKILLSGQAGQPGPAGDPPRRKKKRKRPPF